MRMVFGLRRQKIKHERVFQKFFEGFQIRIKQFKKLQGMGGGETNCLTEGTQSLQI